MTFEIIKRDRTGAGATWLAGPITGKGLDAELRYLSGVYGESVVSYLPTATAKRMAKAERLREYRATGKDTK